MEELSEEMGENGGISEGSLENVEQEVYNYFEEEEDSSQMRGEELGMSDAILDLYQKVKVCS